MDKREELHNDEKPRRMTRQERNKTLYEEINS